MESDRGVRFALLVIAGFLSLAVSLFGVMGWAWGYNPHQSSLSVLIFCLAAMLCFPAYILWPIFPRLSAIFLRPIPFIIWISYGFVEFQQATVDRHNWEQVLVPPIFVPSFIPSILVAVIVSFGTRPLWRSRNAQVLEQAGTKL